MNGQWGWPGQEPQLQLPRWRREPRAGQRSPGLREQSACLCPTASALPALSGLAAHSQECSLYVDQRATHPLDDEAMHSHTCRHTRVHTHHTTCARVCEHTWPHTHYTHTHIHPWLNPQGRPWERCRVQVPWESGAGPSASGATGRSSQTPFIKHA